MSVETTMASTPRAAPEACRVEPFSNGHGIFGQCLGLSLHDQLGRCMARSRQVAELAVSMPVINRDWPLFTLDNGPLMARRLVGSAEAKPRASHCSDDRWHAGAGPPSTALPSAVTFAHGIPHHVRGHWWLPSLIGAHGATQPPRVKLRRLAVPLRPELAALLRMWLSFLAGWSVTVRYGQQL